MYGVKAFISFIEPRVKYLSRQLDWLGTFDTLIDVSPVVHVGDNGSIPTSESRHLFVDLIDGFEAINSPQELSTTLIRKGVTEAILFTPIPRGKQVFEILEILSKAGVAIDLLLNRHTPNRISFKWLLAAVFRKPVAFVGLRSSLRVRTVYAPSVFTFASWVGRVRYERWERVAHIWSEGSPSVSLSEPGVLFADSLVPFHKETTYEYGTSPDPAIYYTRVVDGLRKIAGLTGAKKIYFTQHPNSRNEELPLLDSSVCVLGVGSDDIDLANVTEFWSFGSSSSMFAISRGVPVRFLTFSDLPPLGMHEYIQENGQRLGIPVYDFDGRALRRCRTFSPLSPIRKFFWRKVYAAVLNPKLPSIQSVWKP